MNNILLFFSVSRIGGAESNFIKIATELHSRGYKINLIVVKDNGPLIEILKPILNSYLVLDFTKPIFFLSRVIKYKKFVRENRIDVVFNLGLKVELYSRIFSKVFGIKKVVSNIRSTDDWRKWYHTALDRITQFGVDIWVSNSIAGLDSFVKREKIDLSRTRVIYNYIEDFEVNFSDINIEKFDTVNIGILSNIKEGKGFDDLILIVKKLQTYNIKKFKFIVGGRDLTNGRIIEKCIENNVLVSINFLGYVDDKELFFQNIDIFLLPTYWEGLPTSILESMYYGKPVISTKVGGIPELISHGYNGLLSTPGDIETFEEHIIKLCNSSSLYNMFRSNSIGILDSKFTKSRILDKWIEVLN